MGSEIRKLPDGIVKLKKLRHLFAETLIDNTCKLFRSRSGIYIPNGIFYLKDLQTLKAVESNSTVLALRRAYEGQKLIFKAGWFPKLKFLLLRQMPNLIQVEMEQGTMLSLEKILFRELNQQMKIPNSIEHLKNLKWMICRDMYIGGLTKGTHKVHHFICQVL
ncbi:hypothetical protein LUZ61_008617 [Rhynchospora tenuis]|uniref:Uncharacterized protein n=1 Tax=Rhynchospora tenuis TaxID=198213 RepID=A0AAD5ZVP3_9POAL|nr:hypothetical protein LUZ61_008617 [Rhynchospora tenuis]